MGNNTEDDPTYWINMGYSLTAQGKDEQAIKYYKKALELDPQNDAALINLGIALSKSGELAEAKRNLLYATKLYPDYVEAWINLGYVYGKENNQDEEMNCYNKALKIDPSRAVIWHNRGIFTGKKGNLGKPYPTIKSLSDFVLTIFRLYCIKQLHIIFWRNLMIPINALMQYWTLIQTMLRHWVTKRTL